MSRNSNSRIRFWAAIASLVVPAVAVIALSASHTPATHLGPMDRVANTISPTPNCPTSSPNDGNENTGFGDLGNENSGSCDVGNGNSANNMDGNANGPGPTPTSTPCTDDRDTDC
jgi:hypothetical protein